MNELIVIQPKQIGNEEINSVDARELHGRLGVKKDFTHWIKYNIEKLHLVEGVDYLHAKKGEQFASGTKYISEYILTLDTGKHIAMMTNTETAHSIRTYFIEFEKRAKAIPVIHDPKTQALMTLLAKTDAIEHEQAQQRIMIENVTAKVDDLTPIHSMHTLNSIQGAIQTAAKWYRSICGAKHVIIKTNESVIHVTSMLLDREGVSDIGYIKDTSASLQYLRKLASKYQGEYNAWLDRNSLFSKGVTI